MISDIVSMETKRIVSRFGSSFFYEGSHAEFLRVGVLDVEQMVPKKLHGTVNVNDCRISKITMLSSGELRVWANRDLAVERAFRGFLQKTLIPLSLPELDDDNT